MTRTDVVIVGAGLSGLCAAALLTRLGVQCIVLEARDRVGGRILSVSSDADPGAENSGTGRYDLGPAWFWPDLQPRMRQLAEEFGLPTFSQFTAGAVLVERSGPESAQRYKPGISTEPASMRFRGGMRSLVDAVAASLPPGCVRYCARAVRVGIGDKGLVEIDVAGESGHQAV